MTKFTLFTLCLAMAAGTAEMSATKLPAAFNRVSKAGKAKVKAQAKPKANSAKRFAAKAAEAAPLWMAETQKSFGWNGDEWELMETYDIKYDTKGQKTVQTVTDAEGFVTREKYTWNENGQLATRLSQVDEEGEGDFVDSSSLSREYDSRVVSFITFNDQKAFYNGEWVPSNNYKQNITRNEAGNVTQMERAVFFNGIYDPTYRLNITYGEDGKAVTIEESDLTYDYATGEYQWVVSSKYTDIVWEETDGQILRVGDIEDLFLGNNRIKSAKLDIEGTVADLSVTYLGLDFKAVMSYFDEDEEAEVVSTIEYSSLDFDNSQEGKHYYTYGWDINTTTELIAEEETLYKEVIRETYIYSPDDLILLEQVEYGDGDYFEIESKIQGEIEYDDEHYVPASWTVSEYDYDTEEMIPAFRAEYSDYTDVTSSGVNNIAEVDANAPVNYYNLQGHRIENPSAGIFIRVKGNKSEKVLIK